MGQSARAVGVGAPLKIFISYRHQDAQGTAWGIYWPLEARFGRDNVFFDNGKLRAGEQFLAEINAFIDAADILLVLIGPKWLDIMSERLHRPDMDYVAHEIARGLLRKSDLTVIPVLVDGTQPPDAAALPTALKRLARCHAEAVRHTDLREDMDQLIARLCEIALGGGRVVPAIEPAEGVNVEAVLLAPDAQSAEPPTSDERDHRVRASRIRNDQPIVGLTPDEAHYNELAEETQDNGIVVFLGAGINAEDSTTLFDDEMLAHYISDKVRLRSESADLAEVAQSARVIKGEQRVFQLIKEGLAQGAAPDGEPGYVHRYLARLPDRLAELGYQRRHQMIVTPKYDAALERAFHDEREPFDVVVYMGPGTDESGKFVHVPWDGAPVTIDVPNEYRGLPIRNDMELDRTLIVRINGSVEDPDVNLTWKNNYVVTEDHYIQYLSGSPASGLIPGQIIEKLVCSSCLFLGYAMADWRLRVFLKRVWPGDRLGDMNYWAVERFPTRLEDKLCFAAGVKLYQSSLADYVDGFDKFIAAPATEQALT